MCYIICQLTHRCWERQPLSWICLKRSRSGQQLFALCFFCEGSCNAFRSLFASGIFKTSHYHQVQTFHSAHKALTSNLEVVKRSQEIPAQVAGGDPTSRLIRKRARYWADANSVHHRQMERTADVHQSYHTLLFCHQSHHNLLFCHQSHHTLHFCHQSHHTLLFCHQSHHTLLFRCLRVSPRLISGANLQSYLHAWSEDGISIMANGL